VVVSLAPRISAGFDALGIHQIPMKLLDKMAISMIGDERIFDYYAQIAIVKLPLLLVGTRNNDPI
jgi:hypothetical protein